MKPVRTIRRMAAAGLLGGFINKLQILSVALFWKMPLQKAFPGSEHSSNCSIGSNQLKLFAF